MSERNAKLLRKMSRTVGGPDIINKKTNKIMKSAKRAFMALPASAKLTARRTFARG